MGDCGSGLDTDIDDLSVVDAPAELTLVATAKHLDLPLPETTIMDLLPRAGEGAHKSVPLPSSPHPSYRRGRR